MKQSSSLSFFNRFKLHILKIKEAETVAGIFIIIAVFLMTTLMATITAIGTPTGPTAVDRAFDIVIAISLNSIILFLFSSLIAIVLAFLPIVFPYFTTAATIYTGIMYGVILYIDKSGLTFSILISSLAIFLTIVFGLFIKFLFKPHFKQKSLITILIGIIALSGWQISTSFNNTEQVSTTSQNLTGQFGWKFLTYGSGEDVHRIEFGKDISEKTTSVDASHFITRWSKKRTKFWGFDQSNFPINGRVFMPEGNGPFPLILMVHGNHTMENFSTDGYDYLGKLLASRGFLFVSVDQDFVNYSNVTGQPNDNYKLRTWLLLQHLIQLKDMNENPESIFFQKLNMNKVALAGHSRGGQAAAMAADYETFFDDPKLLNSLKEINIEAVAAISPTDNTVDSKQATLNNIAYLGLHGASDTDVYNFRSKNQFYRTILNDGSNKINSTAYIENANHVQFNTSWGKRDLSLPKGIFLNATNLLKGAEQRQIANVYFTAFFEQVFNENNLYDELMHDETELATLLPDVEIINAYLPSSYETIVNYSNRVEPTGTFNNFKHHEVIRPKNRSNTNHPKSALKLEWSKEAFYTVDLAEHLNEINFTNKAKKLVLTVANASPDINPTVSVYFKKNNNNFKSGEIPLSPVIQIDSTIYGIFDNTFRNGRYKRQWEPIFETIEIPIDGLTLNDFKNNELVIHFNGTNGKVMLEEIGIY